MIKIKSVRSLVLMPVLLASLVGSLAVARPAASQNPLEQVFACTESVQPYFVPAGVSSLTIFVHGAHGSYPDKGALGGFGGYVSGKISVSPQQTLYVWTGCLAKDKLAWGYGNGGYKGVARGSAFGDGGFGGGGSAVTLDPAGQTPLLVAGGGGGGGGNSKDIKGGVGGNGGNPAGRGGDGVNNGWDDSGGCGGCLTGIPNGGGGAGSVVGGAGGGGGGGYAGGGAGFGANNNGGSGGGGGGGLSFAASSVTDVSFGTSTLAKDGAIYIWLYDLPAAEADADGVPDVFDRCPASDRSPTVVIDGRDTGARNHQDVDGCTLSDQITQLAASAKNHGQFVRDVAQLTKDYRRDNLLTHDERKAIVQAARQSNIPPRPHGRTMIEDQVTDADLASFDLEE